MTAYPPRSPFEEALIERVIDAPLELVFNTWADRVHAAVWWRPSGWRTIMRAYDFREGGLYRIVYSNNQYPIDLMLGQFETIEPGRLIRFSLAWNGDGEMDGCSDSKTSVGVSFADAGGRTVQTLHQLPFLDGENEHYPPTVSSWEEILDQQRDYIAKLSGSSLT